MPTPPTRRISPNRMPSAVRKLFDPPPVIAGKSADEYTQQMMHYAAVFDAQNIQQCMLVAMYSDRVWEIARLRRFQASFMYAAATQNGETATPTGGSLAAGFDRVSNQYIALAILIEKAERSLNLMLRQMEVIFANNSPQDCRRELRLTEVVQCHAQVPAQSKGRQSRPKMHGDMACPLAAIAELPICKWSAWRLRSPGLLSDCRTIHMLGLSPMLPTGCGEFGI